MKPVIKHDMLKLPASSLLDVSWYRARPLLASEFLSFLVWLRTYQHPVFHLSAVRSNTAVPGCELQW